MTTELMGSGVGSVQNRRMPGDDRWYDAGYLRGATDGKSWVTQATVAAGHAVFTICGSNPMRPERLRQCLQEIGWWKDGHLEAELPAASLGRRRYRIGYTDGFQTEARQHKATYDQQAAADRQRVESLAADRVDRKFSDPKVTNVGRQAILRSLDNLVRDLYDEWQNGPWYEKTVVDRWSFLHETVKERDYEWKIEEVEEQPEVNCWFDAYNRPMSGWGFGLREGDTYRDEIMCEVTTKVQDWLTEDSDGIPDHLLKCYEDCVWDYFRNSEHAEFIREIMEDLWDCYP